MRNNTPKSVFAKERRETDSIVYSGVNPHREQYAQTSLCQRTLRNTEASLEVCRALFAVMRCHAPKPDSGKEQCAQIGLPQGTIGNDAPNLDFRRRSPETMRNNGSNSDFRKEPCTILRPIADLPRDDEKLCGTDSALLLRGSYHREQRAILRRIKSSTTDLKRQRAQIGLW